MSDIQKQFSSVAKDYDKNRRLFIPCFDDFYGIAIENLTIDKEQPVILDLGAGTGLFSEMVLQKYPQAHIELVDFSAEMLEVARNRLAPYQNITIIQADMNILDIENSKYDAIISSLAIHHLTDTNKRHLYQHIFYGLKAAGVFIHAEQVLASNEHLQKIYHNAWLEKIRNSALSDEDIAMGLERVKMDKRTPLDTQISWLREMGFKNVDCLYKYYDFTVLKAEKE